MTWFSVRAGRLDGDGNAESNTEESLWDALAKPSPRLLFKHSPHCGASMGARRRVLELSAARPDLPIYEVDVIHDRATSQAAESKFEIRHESPQAILFVDGGPVWHASHGAVTVGTILEQLDGGAADQPDR